MLKQLKFTTIAVSLSAALVVTASFSAFAGMSYSEAPMLSQLVGEGQLPPVRERLPEKPLVIEPVEAIGQYGGTWRRVTTNEQFEYIRLAMYGFSLLRFAKDGQEIVPGLADSVTHNEDKTLWTVHLREGLKWSDGYPVTVDDILFWWNDMVLNPDYPEFPFLQTAAGGSIQLVKEDNSTLRFEFGGPMPFFDLYLALWVNGLHGDAIIVPAHYMKEFHPDYSDYTSFDTFDQKFLITNPDYPVLTAWKPVEYEVGDRLVLERNPYYYAVDTEGNQLPYIDRVRIKLVANMEVVKLEAINGNVDMQLRPYLQLSDLALIRQNEQQGDYRTLFWGSGSGTGPLYYPNQNHPDPEKRELYRNSKFLRALSHAIDRERIKRLVFFGLGYVTTGTFSPNTRDFHLTERGQKIFETWTNAYVEYMPDKARRLLDEIGVVDQDGDGWRDLPSGAPLQLRIDQDAEAGTQYIDTNLFVEKDWEAVGLRTVINPVSGAEMQVMQENATLDIRDSWEIGGVAEIAMFPHWLIPITHTRYAPLYGRWYALKDSPKAETELDKAPRDRVPPRQKPPEGSVYARLQELYTKAKTEPDDVKRINLMLDAVELFIEEGPFIIGTVADYPRPFIVKNDFRNVPTADQLPLGGWTNPWNIPTPAITNTETYFFSSE